MARLEVKNLNSPDGLERFEKGRVETVKVGEATIERNICEPGWRWTKHMRSIAKTKLCELTHTVYVVSGTLRVSMADGAEKDLRADDVALIPPGHDVWVVGDEPAVLIAFLGRG